MAHCEDIACSSSTVTVIADASIHNYSGNVIHNYSLSLVIGNDGLPITSYYGGGRVHVARCLDTACTSAVRTEIANPGGDSNSNDYSSIAIGSDGYPIISYLDADNDDLCVVKAPVP